jgi:hypothetical protein
MSDLDISDEVVKPVEKPKVKRGRAKVKEAVIENPVKETIGETTPVPVEIAKVELKKEEPMETPKKETVVENRKEKASDGLVVEGIIVNKHFATFTKTTDDKMKKITVAYDPAFIISKRDFININKELH